MHLCNKVSHFYAKFLLSLTVVYSATSYGTSPQEITCIRYATLSSIRSNLRSEPSGLAGRDPQIQLGADELPVGRTFRATHGLVDQGGEGFFQVVSRGVRGGGDERSVSGLAASDRLAEIAGFRRVSPTEHRIGTIESIARRMDEVEVARRAEFPSLAADLPQGFRLSPRPRAVAGTIGAEEMVNLFARGEFPVSRNGVAFFHDIHNHLAGYYAIHPELWARVQYQAGRIQALAARARALMRSNPEVANELNQLAHSMSVTLVDQVDRITGEFSRTVERVGAGGVEHGARLRFDLQIHSQPQEIYDRVFGTFLINMEGTGLAFWDTTDPALFGLGSREVREVMGHEATRVPAYISRPHPEFNRGWLTYMQQQIGPMRTGSGPDLAQPPLTR